MKSIETRMFREAPVGGKGFRWIIGELVLNKDKEPVHMKVHYFRTPNPDQKYHTETFSLEAVSRGRRGLLAGLLKKHKIEYPAAIG